MSDEECERLEKIWEGIEHLPGMKTLTPRGVAYVHSALFEGRSREVAKTSLFSNSGGLPTKSGLQLDFESESAEGTFILMCELDETRLVLEQPPMITVFAHDSKGRQQNRSQKPDFVRITENCVELIEVKPLSTLETKCVRYPKDWLNDKKGGWIYQPGVNAAQLMGMEHRIFYQEILTPQYRANLRYLAAMKLDPQPPPSGRLLQNVKNSLMERPKSTRELLSHFSELNFDHLLTLILDGKLFGLLHHQTLGLNFVLYGSADQSDRAMADIEAYRLPEIEPGSYAYRLIRATTAERNYALACLRRYKERRNAGIAMNSTDYSHRKRMQAAIAEGAPAIAGLIPNFSDRGGAGTPLPEKDILMLKDFFRQYLGSIKRIPSPSEAHAELTRIHESTDKILPCVETIRKYLAKEFSPERAASLYGGPRAIQKVRRKTEGVNCNERVGIDGMWCQCDAVYSDVVPKEDEDWKITRPIAFPLVMSRSLYIPAAGIIFGRPSALGFLMALRACAQDHGWVPTSLLHDRGSEFNNLIWEETSAHFNMHRIRRATAYSQAGGEAEAINGMLNAYLQTLPGGTYHDQAGRDSDGKRKGRWTAEHTIQTLVKAILDWVECWNNTRHGNNLKTPKEMFEEMLRAFPSSVRSVSMNENTRYVTSYPIKVQNFTYQRGATFAGKKYSCDVAARLIHQGESPKGLRLDSLDSSTIWASSSQGLVRLTSNDYHRVAGMSRIERIVDMAARMRYHIVSKRNQAEYRLAKAKLRHGLETAAVVSAEATSVTHRIESLGKKTPQPTHKISFAELARRSRTSLEIIDEDPADVD